jgi:hypothetical protein
MSTEFLSPNWRMPRNANQSKSNNYSLDFIPNDVINVSGFSTALSNVNNGTRSSDNNLPFSWSVWFKSRNSSNSQGEIAGYGQSQRNGIRIHNNVFRSNYTSDLPGTTTINQNVWYHGVVTYDGTTRKIYVNGSLDASDTPSSAAISNQSLTIGVYPNGSSSFNGELNELCYFDYALSESQITTLYGDSTNVIGNPMALPSTPIAYYPLGTSAWNGDFLAENNAIGDYVFDFASSDSIDTNFTLPNYNSYSISVWYKKDRGTVGALPAGDHYLWGNATSGGANKPRTSVRFNDTNELRIITGDGTVYFQSPDLNVSTLLLDGKWHHILTTTVSGEIKLYIDGGLQATHTNSNIVTGIVAETSYRIGQSGYNAGYLTESLLSNFQLFNTALSGPEVETLYNNGSPIQTLANIPQSSNLKAWYKLDASEIYNSSSTEWIIANNPYNYSTALRLWSNGWNNTPVNQTYQIENGNPRTVSAWIQIPPSSTYNALLAQAGSGTSKYNCVFWGQNFGGLSLFTPVVGNNSSDRFLYFGLNSSNIVRDHWYHIAFTDTGVDGVGRFKTYLNGEFKNQSTLNYDYGTYINGFRWGGTTSDNVLANGVNLVLAHGRMYDVALTNSEIQALYNNGTPQNINNVKPSNLKQWIAFNDQLPTASPWTLPDLSGNNNTANLSYAPLFTSILDPINTKNGLSSGMSQSNLVQSDLQTVAPYSKYALSFDGIDESILVGFSPIVTGVFTISMWIKRTSLTSPESASSQYFIQKDDISANRVYAAYINTSTGNLGFFVSSTGTYDSAHSIDTSTVINDTNWHNVVFVNNGNSILNQVYVDGAEASYSTQGTGVSTLHSSNIQSKLGGSAYYAPANFYGSMSNVSMWNAALTSSQVREIYNEGLPSNLHNFSGTAPVAWWQLGENSSFNGNDWICANEIGSNNGQSNGMPVGALTNGVGTTANGVSTGMSEGSLIGDAPYSTANAISSGMPVTARGTDVP